MHTNKVHINNTGNVRITLHCGVFVQPLLLRKKKPVSITYSERVSVALGIQHAMRMRHDVICGLPDSTVFSHLIHKQYDFRKKKKLLNTKRVFLSKIHV